jgi:parallel beta-helix repeat protein
MHFRGHTLRIRGARGVAFTVFLALAAGAVLWPGTPARAATTLYVDGSNPNCSDTGPGSITQPFCKLSVAAVKATAGSVVQVAAGTYAEQVSIANTGTADAQIVFTAAPGTTPVVTGNGNGFSMSDKSWITINGFFVNGTANYGISVFGGSHVTISNNRVTSAGTPVSGSTRSGIRLTGTTDSLVQGNTSDHNSDHGILITNGSARNRITGNFVFNNAREYTRSATGIRLYQSPDNIVDHNVMHHNEDSGVEGYAGSNNTLFYDNVGYNNGDHGIDNNGCTGQTIVANSIYKNVTAGINVEGGSTGATLANNVAVDNGINSPRTHSNIRVESGSTAGTTMDYDLAYLTTADSLLVWNSVTYYSLASFKAATGQESHGVEADPKRANPTAGDFRLTAGSPAIDSANSGASGQPDTDIDGKPRVDDPATPNTGAGPRAYDDRGAYEFQTSAPQDNAPIAALSVSGAGPLEVTADASGSTDTDATPIASYTFDFGDGTTAVGPQAGATASHTYGAGGTYTVTVTVADTAGLSSTATANVTVAPSDAAPAAALVVIPSSGSAPLSVTADASASTDTDATGIETYAFNFGDGTTVGPQAGPTATHSYPTQGTYTVTVTVTDTAGLSATATATVQVGPPDASPAAALTVTPASGFINLAVTANASASTDTDATPIANYKFDFGDGSAVVGPQPAATATHTYTKTGTFTVTVTVTDTAGLASSATATVSVTDAPPVANLTTSPSSIRVGSSVTASGAGSTDTDATPIATYTFDFGDGTPPVGPQTSPTVNHTYTTPGTFTVTLTVTDTAGNSSSATKKIKVR